MRYSNFNLSMCESENVTNNTYAEFEWLHLDACFEN